MEKKKIDFAPTIVITGLDGAGKTTLLERIRTGKFVENTTPTVGYQIAIIRKDGIRFDVVDLGGHEAFRKAFWKNFVQSALGCIFVFDSSDKERIAVAKEWLWKVEDWLSKDASLAFLANKVDLEDKLPLEDIINGLELQRLSQTGRHSFRIFATSNKTGENVDECWNWITNSILRKFEKKEIPEVLAFELYDERLKPAVSIILNENKKDEIHEIIEVFRTHSLKIIDSLPSITIGDIDVQIIQKGDYYGVIYAPRGSNSSILQEIGLTTMFEALYKYSRQQPVTKEYINEVINNIEL